jgi:membrane protein required for colicin V production
MDVALTDWILLGVLLTSMVVGMWRGLVYEVLSLAGWLAAFVMAQWLAAEVAVHLPFVSGAAAPVQYAVGFVAVFVVTLFAAGLVSWLIKKLVESAGLRPVDRALGGLFGLARGVVVLLALTVVLHLLGMAQQDWWQGARGPGWIEVVIKGIKPVLPDALVEYLP